MTNHEPRPVLTPAIVEQMKRQVNPDTGKRYTQSDIAKRWAVSRQRVSQVKYMTDSYSQTPRERAMEAFPWHVPTEFQRASPDKRLRDHGEFQATGGKNMEQWKLDRLRSFLKMLRDEGLVVEFDPTIAPYEGMSTGGWVYRDRKDSDGDLIIRVNEYTELTELGRRIWVFPHEGRWP